MLLIEPFPVSLKGKEILTNVSLKEENETLIWRTDTQICPPFCCPIDLIILLISNTVPNYIQYNIVCL